MSGILCNNMRTDQIRSDLLNHLDLKTPRDLDYSGRQSILSNESSLLQLKNTNLNYLSTSQVLDQPLELSDSEEEQENNHELLHNQSTEYQKTEGANDGSSNVRDKIISSSYDDSNSSRFDSLEYHRRIKQYQLPTSGNTSVKNSQSSSLSPPSTNSSKISSPSIHSPSLESLRRDFEKDRKPYGKSSKPYDDLQSKYKQIEKSTDHHNEHSTQSARTEILDETQIKGYYTQAKTQNYQVSNENQQSNLAESIAGILKLAGTNYDDNPKLWSALQALLFNKEEIIYKRTQELSEERRRNREIEDELMGTREQLQLLEASASPNIYEAGDGKMRYRTNLNLVEQSTTDTFAAAASAAEAYAAAQDGFYVETEKLKTQIIKQIDINKDLEEFIVKLEEKIAELETDSNFADKEKNLWMQKAQEAQQAEEKAWTELAKYKSSMIQFNECTENEYGTFINQLKRTIAKQQNEIMELEVQLETKHQNDDLLDRADYQDLLKRKEEIEDQLVEHKRIIEELQQSESVYERHLEEHTNLLKKLHEDEVNELRAKCQERDERLNQLEAIVKSFQNDHDNFAETSKTLEKKNFAQLQEYKKIVEEYKQSLEEVEEKYQKEKLKAQTNQEEYILLQNEVLILRRDCRKLRKSLKDRTSELNETITNLKLELEENECQFDEKCNKQIERRETELKEQIDSMVELRTNQRVEALKSRYENKIARMKQQLVHKHAVHLRSSDLRKMIAEECAKLNSTSNNIFEKKNQTFGSAIACHWPNTQSSEHHVATSSIANMK